MQSTAIWHAGCCTAATLVCWLAADGTPVGMSNVSLAPCSECALTHTCVKMDVCSGSMRVQAAIYGPLQELM
jgi:hypothetical protein